MKKTKICLFNILLFVLLFSIINISFAKPMTITQQTTGEFVDINKEFVYYIQTNNAYIDASLENVERIKSVLMKKCNCGFVVFSFQENVDDIWENHIYRCEKFNVFDTVDVFKFTLKDGESITINTINSNPTIYIVREDGYSISYSIDEENFTNYKDSTSIKLVETTMANIKFTSNENGTLTLRRSQPYIPMTITQQTIGELADVNKDFTYYISTNHAHINLDQDQGNIEEIETSVKKCECGFSIFDFQENADDIFDKHCEKCDSDCVEENKTLNKITFLFFPCHDATSLCSSCTIYDDIALIKSQKYKNVVALWHQGRA